MKKDFIELFKYSSLHATHDDYEETHFNRKDLDRLIGQSKTTSKDDTRTIGNWFTEYNFEKCFEILEKLEKLYLK